MITLKDVLNTIAFVLTIVLAIYGLTKGYDVIELFIYNLYFAVVIITMIQNLFDKRKTEI